MGGFGDGIGRSLRAVLGSGVDEREEEEEGLISAEEEEEKWGLSCSECSLSLGRQKGRRGGEGARL